VEKAKISLSNNRLSLREFTKEDWIHVHQYASLETVCQYQPWGPNTEKETQEFVDQIIDSITNIPRERYAFAISYTDENKMIGTVELNIRDFHNRCGEISYILHPDYWGMGIAKDAARLIMEFGFNQCNLHRIYATCDPRNIASAKLLEKVGMTFEGRIRDDLLIRDGWRDSMVFGILKHEWGK
jgi:RimJ/RimL family protein N-acetyltransferase